MSLWDKVRGITKILAINKAWLETQDKRLQRLEAELEVMRREAEATRRYEQARRRLGTQ